MTSNEENTFSVITTADGGFAAAGSNNSNVWLDKFVVPSLSTVHQTTPISTSSPTVPEFPSLTIPMLLIIIATSGLWVYLKKHKAGRVDG